MDLRIAGRERVTVPAGTFDTFRIEGSGIRGGREGVSTLGLKLWYAPDQARMAIAEEFVRRIGGGLAEARRRELVAFKQS
jgi:hypothetical protein